MNARRFETTLIALAVLMILVSAYQLFLRPLGDTNAHSSWQAWLRTLENSAKHRRADDLVWRDLFPGDRLGAGDSIFTGRDARAQLKFREGQELTLSANTLVRLKNEQNLNQLLLEQGVVQATLGSEALELEMDGKKVQLSGDGAQVQIVRDGAETALSVVEGKAELKTESQQVSLAANEEVKVGKDLTKRVLAYPLKAPREGAQLWQPQDARVEFSWSNPQNHELKLIVARDLKLQDVVSSTTVTGESVTLPLVPGSFTWQLTGADGSSRIGTFSLRREPELELIAPKGVVTLPLSPETRETRLTLEWSDSQVAAYVVKVNEQELTTAGTQLPVDVPVGESIRWSVTPKDPARPLARASSVAEFRVQPLALPLAPLWQKEGPLQLSRGKARGPDLFFTGEAPRFEFEVREQDKVLETGELLTQSLAFPELAAGRYAVRVRGIDGLGRAGAWSKDLLVEWTPFENRAADEGQKIVLSKPDQKITFEWDGEGEQVFELASDENFKDVVVTQKGNGEAQVVFPKVGTFYWRARQANGTYSEPRKVLVEPSPPLDAPGAPPSLKKEIEIKFIEPKSSWVDFFISSAIASDFETSVILELPENEQAVSYHVEIFADEELHKRVFTTRTTKTEFEWKGARPGKYWWRYALVDAWGRETAMGPAAELRLTEGDAEAPGKPKLIRPIKAVELDELPQVIFAWTPAARTQDYQLEVSSDDDFDELLATTRETKTQAVVATDQWPRGETLYWRVKARHQWGETASNTGRFIVGKKPVLTAEQKAALPLRPLEAYSWLRAGLEPQKLSVEIDDREFNGKIDGNVLNSLSLGGRKILSKRWSVSAALTRQSGKVFKGEEFSRLDLLVSGEWFTRLSAASFLYVGLGIDRVSTMTYKLATPSELSGESVSALSPRVSLEHEWRFAATSSLHTEAAAAFGDWTSLAAKLAWRQFLRHDLFWEAGGSFEQATFKAPRGDNKFSSLGVAGRVGLSF